MRDVGTDGLVRKILVIDDSELVLQSVEFVLKAAGFEVITLDNPLLAAGVMRKEQPDAVLLDVNMPVLQGDRLMQIVKERQLTGTTRIVLFSELPEAELATRAAASGAAGYLRKSAKSKQIVDFMHRLLATPLK